MPTFDIVCKPDLQLVDNAINTANRKIAQRYDFKGVDVTLELNKKTKTLLVVVPDEMKLKAVREIVLGSLNDQGVSMKTFDWEHREDASLGAIRINAKMHEGLDKETAKDITKRIKDSGLKVKTSIQGDQVRVEGKQIDDLQQVIALLKDADYERPLSFENMKR
ncbi:MAG: YajQ family cyclic di-GMP-binding protein [Sumerlaeia bacterium]